jgi:hypothetical protein
MDMGSIFPSTRRDRSVVRIRELGESFDGEALVADAEGSGD